MTAAFALRVDGWTYRGRGVDLRGCGLDPAAVATAIRRETRLGSESGPDSDSARSADATADATRAAGPRDVAVAVAVSVPVSARASTPGRATLERVSAAPVRSARRLLAAVARSRGLVAPRHDRLRAVETALAEATPRTPPDLSAARARVAAAGGETERLREAVATARGRLQASPDADAETARAELADVARRLSEAETERIAARQALDRAERRARAVRDAHERRLRLRDRLTNLRREARAHLAAEVRDRFAAAVGTLSDGGVTDGAANPAAVAAADPTLARLAAVRVADLDAPVVVETDRLGGAASTADRLDAAVALL